MNDSRWQTDAEILAALIEHRHEALSANFNQYVVSEATMVLCARIQRHVLACYVRDGNGLLRAKENHHERNVKC